MQGKKVKLSEGVGVGNINTTEKPRNMKSKQKQIDISTHNIESKQRHGWWGSLLL